MAHRRATVTINSLTGVPKDAVVNTFHFTTPTGSGSPSTVGELESIRDALVAFYDTTVDATAYGASGDNKVGVWLSGISLTPTLTIRIYRCETEIAVGASPEPIITYEVDVDDFGGGGTTSLPEECAVCLSFRGVLDTSLPAARQRGRVFIGPLTSLGVGPLAVVGARTRVSVDCRATLAAAGAALRTWAVDGVEWVVWSHAALQAFPVAAGWVDDAFDTQRRRGPAASLRTTW